MKVMINIIKQTSVQLWSCSCHARFTVPL